VQKVYQQKHYPAPPKSSVASQLKEGSESAPVPEALSIEDLVKSLAGTAISPVPPFIEGDISPPCPISTLPSELLIEILKLVAKDDVAAFARSAQVCKRFAFLVSTEESIWKAVLFGSKFGIHDMKMKFEKTILGAEEPIDHLLEDDGLVLSETELSLEANELVHSLYKSSYREMYRHYPRIRFTGLYISTVNYARPGASSPLQVTWNTPVHIVTYYRYLRFFRDGTVLSLLSTAAPSEVVPVFSKETSQGKDVPQTNFMYNALRGRWRLALPSIISNETVLEEMPGAPLTPLDEIEIETEGAMGGTEKYTYKMRLVIKGTPRANGSQGTRLAWKGYWSYNCVSDDWAVFGLKNDRAFKWVKVGAWRDL
jgi:F-box protein 9